MLDPSSDPFHLLVRHFTDLVSERLKRRASGTRRVAALARPKGSVSPAKGRKVGMRCRYPGCKNKSKGQRFRFLCAEHLRLPKEQQDAALEK